MSSEGLTGLTVLDLQKLLTTFSLNFLTKIFIDIKHYHSIQLSWHLAVAPSSFHLAASCRKTDQWRSPSVIWTFRRDSQWRPSSYHCLCTLASLWTPCRTKIYSCWAVWSIEWGRVECLFDCCYGHRWWLGGWGQADFPPWRILQWLSVHFKFDRSVCGKSTIGVALPAIRDRASLKDHLGQAALHVQICI